MRSTFNSPAVVVGAALALAELGVAALPALGQDRDSSPAAADHRTANDTEVAAHVKAALHADRYFNARHVKVSVQNGDVVLSGLVESDRSLQEAGQIATKAADGRNVINRLKIEQNYPNAP